MPSKSDTLAKKLNVASTAAATSQDSKLTRNTSANEEWKSRNLWLDTLDDDCLSSDEDQNDLTESNSKLKEDVCSPPLLPPPAAAETQPVSHGMSSSELGRVIRADHDYIELLVKVKVEDTSSDEEEEIAPEVPIDIKEEVIEGDSKQSMFDNLSTLAEVSLATAGQLEDKTLKRKIDQARAKISKTILPVTPEQSSKRTMQITLPENTTHIVICTSGEGSSSTATNAKREVIRTVVKTSINNNLPTTSAASVMSKNSIGGPGIKSLGKDTYECGECGKTYSTSSNLARHKQTHRSLSDKKAKKCVICGKVYVSMPAYAMHMRTHNQNCKCSICGKSFSRPWLLQGHVRTHTGERPYKCSLCPKAFADKSNLRAHTQTHSNSKPFECRHCGKTFALKSYLYKHEEASCSNPTTSPPLRTA